MEFFARIWRWLLSLFTRKDLKITIVGLPNAGKTTLVKAIANQNTEEQTVPTIGAQHQDVRVGKVNFSITDIGGSQKYKFLWSVYCKNSDFILFVIDAADSESVDSSAIQLESLLNDSESSNVPILIIANKLDLPGCISAEDISSKFKLQEVDDRKIEIFALSAKTKKNFDQFLKYVLDNF